MSDAYDFTLAEFCGGPMDGERLVIEGVPHEWKIALGPPPMRPFDPPDDDCVVRLRVGIYRRQGSATFHLSSEVVALHGDRLAEIVERGALPCRYDWQGEW